MDFHVVPSLTCFSLPNSGVSTVRGVFATYNESNWRCCFRLRVNSGLGLEDPQHRGWQWVTMFSKTHSREWFQRSKTSNSKVSSWWESVSRIGVQQSQCLPAWTMGSSRYQPSRARAVDRVFWRSRMSWTISTQQIPDDQKLQLYQVFWGQPWVKPCNLIIQERNFLGNNMFWMIFPQKGQEGRKLGPNY